MNFHLDETQSLQFFQCNETQFLQSLEFQFIPFLHVQLNNVMHELNTTITYELTKMINLYCTSLSKFSSTLDAVVVLKTVKGNWLLRINTPSVLKKCYFLKKLDIIVVARNIYVAPNN